MPHTGSASCDQINIGEEVEICLQTTEGQTVLVYNKHTCSRTATPVPAAVGARVLGDSVT